MGIYHRFPGLLHRGKKCIYGDSINVPPNERHLKYLKYKVEKNGYLPLNNDS